MDMLKSVGGKVKSVGSSAISAPVDLVNTQMMHKEKVKVKFEITLKSANNLEPAYNGRNVFIEWKRGSKKERTGTPSPASAPRFHPLALASHSWALDRRHVCLVVYAYGAPPVVVRVSVAPSASDLQHRSQTMQAQNIEAYRRD